MTTSTVTSKLLQRILHDHLKICLKTRQYATIRSLQVKILIKIQYNFEYSNYVTDPSSAGLANFINQFDPKKLFKIVRSLKIVHDKNQRLTQMVN